MKMTIIGVIPARYGSSRLQGKPLVDISGKPLVWWVYQRALKAKNLDGLVVATEAERVVETCRALNMNCMLTSDKHETPTSRLYEVSTKIDGDYFMFISGDEPLIDVNSIEKIASQAREGTDGVINAMTRIKRSSAVIDYSNIKVTVNENNYLLYTTRSPIPYPKGGLEFDYMKFVGLGAFSRNALKVFNETRRSKLEMIEECDLLRFIAEGIPVKMLEIPDESLSVDTLKDLEYVRNLIADAGGGGVTPSNLG